MFNKTAAKKYSEVQLTWIFIKVQFILVFSAHFFYSLSFLSSFSTTKGVCLFVNCEFLLDYKVKISIILFHCFFSFLYVFEKKMILTTFFLAVNGFLVFSAHESFGVQDRTGILTLIFFAQFIAYCLISINPQISTNNIQQLFSLQVIVACYTLSAISKLLTSGYQWFLDGHLSTLQILKTYQAHYLDGFNPSMQLLEIKTNFIINYQPVWIVFLFIALLIELSSGLALVNTKMKFIYGLLLLSLHLGIGFFFGIYITAFIFPMIIFMLNPLYICYKLMSIKK
jgi:hypothetical protein